MSCINGYAPDAENLACVPSDRGKKRTTRELLFTWQATVLFADLA